MSFLEALCDQFSSKYFKKAAEVIDEKSVGQRHYHILAIIDLRKVM
jgi:hypothetical protein